jgi:hypothetical protein
MLTRNIFHELDVVEHYFCRGSSWVEIESAKTSTELDGIDNNSEYIEDVLFHPNGAIELEQIICRSTINELNALIEFALQTVAMKANGGDLALDSMKLIVGANRSDLEGALVAANINIKVFCDYYKIQEIKELSEAFKHRQRFRPLPRKKLTQSTEPDKSIVPGRGENFFEEYEINTSDVSIYIQATKELFLELRQQSLI